MAKSILASHSNTGTVVAASSTRYFPPMASHPTDTVNGQAFCPVWRTAGRIDRLKSYVAARTGTTALQVVFRRNGVATALLTTYTSGQTGEKEDLTNVVDAFVGNQFCNVVAVPTSNSITVHSLAERFTPDSDEAISYFGAMNGAPNSLSTTQIWFGGNAGAGNTGSLGRGSQVRGAFTMDRLWTYVVNNGRSANVVFNDYVNGVAGSMTTVYTPGQTGGKEDTSGTKNVVAGDTIAIIGTPAAGSGTFTVTAAIMRLRSVAEQRFRLNCGHGAGQTFNSPTTYLGPGTPGSQATQANGQFRISFDAWLTDMSAHVIANTSAGSCTFDVMVENVATALGVTYTTGQTGFKSDTSTSIAVLDDDRIGWRVTNAGASGSVNIGDVSLEGHTTISSDVVGGLAIATHTAAELTDVGRASVSAGIGAGCAARLVDTAQAGGAALERAYLPLNGANQYGFAADALDGIAAADTWTVAWKLNSLAGITGYRAWLYAYDDTVTGTNEIYNRIWTVVQQEALGVYVGKATGAGVAVINDGGSIGVTTAVRVIAVTQSPGALKVRTFGASGLIASHTFSYTPGAPNDRAPLHLAMGAQLNESHGIAVPSQMGNGQYVGIVVTLTDPSDAELGEWVGSPDARVIDSVRNYWPMAFADGATVPDLIGGSPMTLVNITDAALVWEGYTPRGNYLLMSGDAEGEVTNAGDGSMSIVGPLVAGQGEVVAHASPVGAVTMTAHAEADLQALGDVGVGVGVGVGSFGELAERGEVAGMLRPLDVAARGVVQALGEGSGAVAIVGDGLAELTALSDVGGSLGAFSGAAGPQTQGARADAAGGPSAAVQGGVHVMVTSVAAIASLDGAAEGVTASTTSVGVGVGIGASMGITLRLDVVAAGELIATAYAKVFAISVEVSPDKIDGASLILREQHGSSAIHRRTYGVAQLARTITGKSRVRR